MHDMNLYHYTTKVLTPMSKFRQFNLLEDGSCKKQVKGMKPVGFWLSVEDEWEQWCKSEQFMEHSLARKYKVQLSKDANILHLKSELDIDMFTKKYKYFGDDSPNNLIPTFHVYDIDWAKVEEKYDGIIIEPYCWSRRLASHTIWYYGWDVASGCIWNLNVIESVIKQSKKAVENSVK